MTKKSTAKKNNSKLELYRKLQEERANISEKIYQYKCELNMREDDMDKIYIDAIKEINTTYELGSVIVAETTMYLIIGKVPNEDNKELFMCYTVLERNDDGIDELDRYSMYAKEFLDLGATFFSSDSNVFFKSNLK